MMTENFNYITSRGLPGGPNQEITYVTGVASVEGYRYDSPDKNNSVNLIESGNISMSENDGSPLKKGPLLGIDNLGNKQIMTPGTNYSFPGDKVLEIPMAQKGNGEFRDFKGIPFLSSIAAGDFANHQHHNSRLADLYRYYSGRPLEDNILQVSNTKPTKAKDPDAKYISLNKNQQLVQEVIDNYNRVSNGNFYTNKTRPDLILDVDDNEKQLDKNNYKVTGYREVDNIDDYQLNAIGNYFTGFGEDENGTYISYYDKFDQAGGIGGSINFGEKLGLTKPFEIYDRIYVEKDKDSGKYIQKKKGGGQLPKAQYAGEGVKIDDDVVKNSFQSQWLDSPMYKEILANEVGPSDDADFITFGRKSNLDDVPIRMMEGEYEEDKGVAATSNSATGRITFYKPSQDGLDEGHAYENTVEHEIGHSGDRVGEDTLKKYEDNLSIGDRIALANASLSYRPSSVFLPNYVSMANQAYNYITGQETNDLEDRATQIYKNLLSERLIPTKTIKRFNDERLNIEGYNDNGSPVVNDYDIAYYKKYDDEGNPIVSFNKDGTIQKGSIEIFKDDWADYVSEPTEARTRLNTIRSAAKDLGIYDPFTEKLTPEKFQELKSRLKDLNRGEESSYNPLWQLQGIYSDDEIFDMLNTISDVSKVSDSKLRYAQKGGSSTNPYTIYMNYINGIDDSDAAKNIFDKLNRIHYKDAKERGMGVANYIATNVITDS
jgi:hypothetical protein